jgi:hypothetical protein
MSRAAVKRKTSGASNVATKHSQVCVSYWDNARIDTAWGNTRVDSFDSSCEAPVTAHVTTTTSIVTLAAAITTSVTATIPKCNERKMSILIIHTPSHSHATMNSNNCTVGFGSSDEDHAENCVNKGAINAANKDMRYSSAVTPEEAWCRGGS